MVSRSSRSSRKHVNVRSRRKTSRVSRKTKSRKRSVSRKRRSQPRRPVATSRRDSDLSSGQVPNPERMASIKGKSEVITRVKECITLDNGGSPFKVIIRPSDASFGRFESATRDGTSELYSVEVYIRKAGDTDQKPYNVQVYSCNATQVFIGKSPKIPMTKFSGGWGPKFDGNSVLVRVTEPGFKYVFIGESVFEFTAEAQITDFVSPVGNSAVPYPWAVDTDGRYYLMIENAVFKPTDNDSEQSPADDPYMYFYNIKKNRRRTIAQEFKNKHMLVKRQ